MTVNGTAVTDKGTIVLDDIVKLTGGATIEGVSSSALGTITNNGTLEVAGAAELLYVTLTDTGSTIQVDDSQTLTLSGTEIIGGIINDFSGPVGGKIDIAGDSKIDNGATLNHGLVTVESGMKLTLDNVTVNGTVFNDLVTGGTIQIDGGDTLMFNGATVNGGTLNISGELDSTGISFITGATIVNSSHIDVISGTLTIDPAPVTNTGTIEVKGDSTLVLSEETITNTKGFIQVDATDSTHFSTLDLEGSTIHGGTLVISGELDSTGDSFITGATITNTGTIDVTGGTLTIDATSTLDNTNGTLETNGGNLIIDARIVGNLEIKGGAVLELGSSLASAYSHATVTFEPGSTGTLKLDHSKTFSGAVAGFDANTTIDLADIAYGSNVTASYAGNAAGGILSVFVGGIDVSNIDLTGDYLGVHWTLADDGSHGTDVTESLTSDLTATLDSTTAQQGLAIHVTGVKDGGVSVSSGVSYAWQVSSDNGLLWTTVGTHSSFTPIAAEDGETLQVVITYANSEENESVTYSLGAVAPAKEWLGGSHDWQSAGHWASSGVPTASDNAVVDASGVYTLEIDHDAAAHSLVVHDFGAAVEIARGSTLTLGGNATIEAGILQIDSGATLKDIATSASITGPFIDNGTIEAAGGKLEIASAVHFGEGTFKIDAGATLQFDHADTNNVVFAGSGELALKDPAHFSGTISDRGGGMTSADVVDVAGFDASATVSYSGTTSHGIVTISEADHTSVHLKVGANSTNWSIPVADGDGGILIHDPPASTSTVVASGPNQILTGNAASDTFAFNFSGVGHTTVTDFHPVTDMLQLSSDLFANLESALNATHDDGHGNTVIALDAHDTITLNGIVKAQLHASDFHFV